MPSSAAICSRSSTIATTGDPCWSPARSRSIAGMKSSVIPPWPTPFSTASSIAPIASTSKAHRCAGASSLVKAPLHDRPCTDRPRGPTAPPRARRSVAREGTARRARVPSVDSMDDPLPLDRHHLFSQPVFVSTAQVAATLTPPRLATLRRDHDHRNAQGGVNTPELQQADNDYAVGLLVQAVAHSPYAKDTLI